MARIGVDLSETAIDLGSGFIVVVGAIETEKPPLEMLETAETPAASTEPVETAVPAITAIPAPGAPPQTTVRLSMRMTRQQLYASFNAIGNLADAADSIRVAVEAQKLDGFDPTWLRNAVLEPLDEADAWVEEER